MPKLGMNVDAFGSASPIPPAVPQRGLQTPPPRTWSGTNSAAGTATCCGTKRPTWHQLWPSGAELLILLNFFGVGCEKKPVKKGTRISGIHIGKKVMWLKTQSIKQKGFLAA